MNEKIKFQNGSLYDLAPGGAYFGEETAKLILVVPEGKSYDDAEIDVTGNGRIEIFDVAGEKQETRTGYAYLDELTRKKDYVIGIKQVAGEPDPETGEVSYTNQNVIGTVLIAVLKKADVRQELAMLKEKVKEQSDTIDMMLVADLEG